jgi:glycosyltransferase involved in cell wall biosynthesis
VRSPIPFAFTIHDLVHLKVQEESSAVRRAYYASVVRPAARRAMRVLTVSEVSRQDIIEWARLPESAVVVVGNGVSEAFTPEPASHPVEPYFLHVGRRAGHKNVPRLLAAFSACRSNADAKLVFTGVPDSETMRHVSALGLASRVRFEGEVSDASLADLYRHAIALVFPSLQEGFGLPVIEAMACGTPVITSDVPSLREIAGEDNAMFVDPRSTEAIAAAMDAAAFDRSARERLRTRGLARAGEFRWPQVAARVLATLQP